VLEEPRYPQSILARKKNKDSIPIGAGIIDVVCISMDDVFAVGGDGIMMDAVEFPAPVVEFRRETKS